MEQLLLHDPASISAALGKSMQLVLEKAKVRTSAVKTWRHKYLAHADMKHAFLAQPPVDSEIKYSDVDDIIELFGEYLNLFHEEFEQVTTVFAVAGDAGDVRLVRRLRDARLFRTLPPDEQRRMRTGA